MLLSGIGLHTGVLTNSAHKGRVCLRPSVDAQLGGKVALPNIEALVFAQRVITSFRRGVFDAAVAAEASADAPAAKAVGIPFACGRYTRPHEQPRFVTVMPKDRLELETLMRTEIEQARSPAQRAAQQYYNAIKYAAFQKSGYTGWGKNTTILGTDEDYTKGTLGAIGTGYLIGFVMMILVALYWDLPAE